jgi:hypothetical protein
MNVDFVDLQRRKVNCLQGVCCPSNTFESKLKHMQYKPYKHEV